MRNDPKRLGRVQGASMIEFLVVAPVLLLLGLGGVQAGLIYHGKTILSYATFEAARVGATRHALREPMLRELGLRLAPLQGGDGSATAAAAAIARSIEDVVSPVARDGSAKPPTRLRVLNPTREAFDAWGEPSVEHAGRVAIPNAHLRHRDSGEVRAGVSLRDANLLKIEVVHGLELKVPLVNRVLSGALALLDPGNTHWYRANRLPLRAVATLRMQSEAWAEALAPAVAPTAEAGVPDALENTPGGGGGRGPAVSSTACGADGLPSSAVLIATAEYEGQSCSADPAIAADDGRRFEGEAGGC